MFGRKEGFNDPRRPTNNTPRSKINVIKPSAQFQFTDISRANPLIKLSNNATISTEGTTTGGGATGASRNNGDVVNTSTIIDGKIFEMGWRSLVGTDLVFDDYGELVGRVKEHLVHEENVKIVARDGHGESVEGEEENGEGGAEDAGKGDGEAEEKDTQSMFLKKALKLAKRKESSTKEN